MPDHDTSPEPVPQPSAASRRTVLRALAVVPLSAGLISAGTATGPRVLRAGMSGTDVRELQIRVAGWASDEPHQTFLAINGTFDAATEAAVRRFQQAHALPATGVVEPATHGRLAALAAPDGSTTHFDWAQFTSPDGSGYAGGAVDETTARENARRLMYKLEALRHKLDGRDIVVRTGFHSTAHQTTLRGPVTDLHSYGGTADITVPGLTTYALYQTALTCGFSGLGSYTQSWLHCDSRREYPVPCSGRDVFKLRELT